MNFLVPFQQLNVETRLLYLLEPRGWGKLAVQVPDSGSHMHTWIRLTHAHIHTQTHTHTNTQTHTHIHTQAHTQTHTYTHKHTHTNTHIHTLTHTHTHTYAHTHTHTYSRLRLTHTAQVLHRFPAKIPSPGLTQCPSACSAWYLSGHHDTANVTV
jgi:hypothetical protein